MAIHIRSFTGKKYRGLRDVTLKNLGHINVITGKNNTGKTSLLELITTLDNPLWGESWVKAVFTRKAGVTVYSELQRMIPFGDNAIEYEFLLGNETEPHHVRLNSQVAETMVTERELMRLNGFIQTGARKAEYDTPHPAKQLQLHISFDGNSREFGVYDKQTAINTRGNSKESFIKCAYVSTFTPLVPYGSLLVPLFVDPELHDAMIGILRVFDERIDEINLVENECYVSGKRIPFAIPLSAYGDGMKKAVLLMAAIVNARDGIVLVDEFETFMHMSALPETYAGLLKAADKLNVQLFFTSHNEAAIVSLLKADEYICNNSCLYTLHEEKGQTLVRRLDGATALDVTSWGVRL